MKEYINRIISFLIAFLLFSLNIFNTVSIFALDTFDDSDIVVINTIIDNKESLTELKKMGLHNPLIDLEDEETLENNYSENSESDGEVTILNINEDDSEPVTSESGEVEENSEIEDIVNIEDSIEEKEMEEKIEDTDISEETENLDEIEEVSSKENSSKESEEVIEIDTNKPVLDSEIVEDIIIDETIVEEDERDLIKSMSNDVSFLSDTIEIGGNVYNIADFHNMDEFLLAAYIISNDVKYDLIAGEAPSDMNIYLDFDVELTLQFATSSSLTRLNKLYAWEFTGITVGNPIDGQLLGDDGTVYGDYHIGSDGKIYVALNDEGVQQSVIKWNLVFSGLWNNTNGDSITIDLGNGNIITIQLDKSKGSIVKEAEDGGSYASDSFDRGKTIRYYTIDINNYTNIDINSIYDVFKFEYGYDGIYSYLEYSGKTLEEVFILDNFKFELIDENGTETEYPISSEDITINYTFDEYDVGKIQTEIIFDEPFNIPVDVDARFKYRLYVESDFYEYFYLQDFGTVRMHNYIDIVTDDETLSDSDSYYIDDLNLVDKFMYLDNYKNGRGYVDWGLSLYASEDIDFGGYLITDKLSGSLEYVFPYTGGSIITLTMQEGYDSVYKRIPWVECSSQEEFNSLNENNFPVTDGSAIYWYGNSFKYLVPQLEGHIQEVWLEYCTTYDEALETTNGKYVLNQAIVEKNGLHDETLYVEKPMNFTKVNTGFRVDSDGDTVTNWCLDWFIPANNELKDFFFEDYTPFKHVDDTYYIDKVKLNTEPNQYLNIYSQEQANELGINFSIKTEDGRDLTNELMYKFIFWDRTDYIRNGEICPYIYLSLTDEANKEDSSYGGFSAYPEDLYIHLDFPMTLEGNSVDFKNHTNICSWYYDGWGKTIHVEDTLILPNYNNDFYFRKNLIKEELSEDGSEIILTYEVRHNVSEYLEGNGFTYKDILPDTTYAKFIQNSLKVYWVEDINDSNLTYYEYPFSDSEYAWERDLLEIKENVNYYLDSGQNNNENPIYVSVPMATIKEQSKEGFELEIPYYGRTPKFCWYTAEWSRRYYSPVIRYQLALNVDKLNQDGIYRYNLINNISAYSKSGEMESTATSDYFYKHSVLDKQMIQVPDKTNKYTAKYEVIIEANNPLLDGINRIHLIDEMTKDMNLLTDSVLVEYSDDNLNWKPLDEDLFRLLYDSSIHTMTCIIDNDVVKNYYRVSYDVRVIGLSGQTVTISNNAHISGFKNVGDDISNDITIVQPEGNVEADMTEIVINKYDADNLELKLQGAEFELYTIRVLTAEELELLNSFSSKEEVLDYINNQMTDPWISLSSKTTDENGQIIWRNHEDGLLLPLNTLLKVEEKSVPEGYFSNGDSSYFFLSVDKGASAERLTGKYITYFECRDHIANIFIANKKGSFTIQKVDGDNNKLLRGAEFGLYSDFECTNLVENSIEYDNGLYYFPALTLGSTYYLKELKAPVNYKLDETVYTVTVGLDGVITISHDLETTVDGYIVFENYYDTVESDTIPNTGGNGYKYYRLIGLMLILGSLGAYIIILKSKKSNN